MWGHCCVLAGPVGLCRAWRVENRGTNAGCAWATACSRDMLWKQPAKQRTGEVRAVGLLLRTKQARSSLERATGRCLGESRQPARLLLTWKLGPSCRCCSPAASWPPWQSLPAGPGHLPQGCTCPPAQPTPSLLLKTTSADTVPSHKSL